MPKNMETVLLFDIYGSLLSRHQREIFDVYYNDDLSLSEIAENFGITRQGVLNAVKKAEKKLADFEESLHIADRMKHNRLITQNIRELAEGIVCGQTNARDSAEEIINLAAKIQV